MTRPAFIILLATLSLVAMVAGCGGAHRYDSRLVLADSLMQANPDSALALVQAVDADSLSTEGDRAYRDLLLTQARYKCYITATSDSAINRALAYYRHHKGEREKLTRAYIYKGAVMEELGYLDSAMLYYKTAESVADTADYFNQGFCNLRIAELYQFNHSVDTVVNERMRKAMECFVACRDTNYIIISMGSFGSYLYRINEDSAKVLLKQAISLARSANSPKQYFYQSKLAGINFYQQDYQQAKTLAMDIINNGKDLCDEKVFYYYAARSFIKLGHLDSAFWVSSIIPEPVIQIDSLNHYLLHAELAKASHDMVNYGLFSANAERIHRKILEGSSNSSLLMKELECDASLQQAQLKNTYNTKIILIIVGMLILFVALVAAARRTLMGKNREFQQELDAAQQEIKRMVEESEKQISELLAERKKDKSQIKQINKQLSKVNKINRQPEQRDQDIHERASAIVRERNAALNELYDDIRIVFKSESEDEHRKSISLGSLIKDYHENRKIRLLTPKESFWKKLKVAVDLEYDGIASFMEHNYPQMTPREHHLFWLVCANVPQQIIKLCMNYTTAVTVSNNKRRLMKDRIGMDIKFDDFIKMYLNGELGK